MKYEMRNMAAGDRRWLAVAGGVVAGIALGGGLDALLAHLDGYLMQTVSWSDPPGFPGLASFSIVVFGALFGLGIGLIGAALIAEPSAQDQPIAATAADPGAEEPDLTQTALTP
jgi:hypothetical protein